MMQPSGSGRTSAWLGSPAHKKTSRSTPRQPLTAFQTPKAERRDANGRVRTSTARLRGRQLSADFHPYRVKSEVTLALPAMSGVTYSIPVFPSFSHPVGICAKSRVNARLWGDSYKMVTWSTYTLLINWQLLDSKMLLKEEQRNHLVVPKSVAFCSHTLVQGPFTLAVATEIAANMAFGEH